MGSEKKPSRPEGERDLNGNLRHRRDGVSQPVQSGEASLLNPDTFLSEDALVRLAMRELNGRLPPGFSFDGRRSDAFDDAADGPGSLGRGATKRPENPHGRKTVLAHELENRGWTTRELAKAAGFTQSEALALARGHARISPDVARTLAKIFATSEEFWL